jgi:hypothetical protein
MPPSGSLASAPKVTVRPFAEWLSDVSSGVTFRFRPVPVARLSIVRQAVSLASRWMRSASSESKPCWSQRVRAAVTTSRKFASIGSSSALM